MKLIYSILYPPSSSSSQPKGNGLVLYPAERSLELFRIIWFYTLSLSMFLQTAVYGSSLCFMPHLPWGERQLMKLGDSVLYPILVARLTAGIAAFLIAHGSVRHTLVYVFIFLNALSLYIISIFDTFQHHYLYILVTLLAGLDPPAKRWMRTREAILLITALVYFWTAVAKLTSPRFMAGLFMRDGLFLRSEVDRLLGYILLYFGRDQGEWIVIEFFRLSSVGVVMTELFLAFSLLWQPFHWLNTLLMLGLHLTIGAMQLILDNMHIGFFSIYMIAISLLTLPETAWIEKWLISFERKRDLIHQRIPPSSKTKGGRWIAILILTIVLFHFVLALSYYIDPWRDPLDERFAWRMFSDLSARNCEWKIFALFKNSTELQLEAKLFQSIPTIRGMMSQRVLRFMSHLVCFENPDVVEVSYIGFCAVPVPSDGMVYYSLTEKEEEGIEYTTAITNCSHV